MRDHTEIEPSRHYADLISRFCADSIVITDGDGLTEWVNEAFTQMTGFTVDDMAGKKPGVVLQGPETDRDTVVAISKALQKRQPIQTEILNYDKQGVPYWIELRINPVFDDAGRHTHFISAERDVTERKRLEKLNEDRIISDRMRQEERALLSQTSEWLYSAKSLDELLRVVQTAMHTIFPETSGQLYVYSNSRDTLDLMASWGESSTPCDAHMDADSCWGLRRGRVYAYGIRAIEFPCDHHKDHNSPSLCLPIIAHGETIGLMVLEFPGSDQSNKHNIQTELLRQRQDLALLCAEQISLAIANVKLRQELQDQSTRDPLTSLWNRRWLLDSALREINRARPNNAPVSLISLDVDHFKKFNDHHGHDAGDIVLREVGELMTQHFADRFYPCRIGGEEFVVLCPDATLEEAAQAAEKFREAVARHQVSYGRAILPRITVSGGVATFPADGKDVISLLRAADERLYEAKAAGRNAIVRPKPRAGKRKQHKATRSG